MITLRRRTVTGLLANRAQFSQALTNNFFDQTTPTSLPAMLPPLLSTQERGDRLNATPSLPFDSHVRPSSSSPSSTPLPFSHFSSPPPLPPPPPPTFPTPGNRPMEFPNLFTNENIPTKKGAQISTHTSLDTLDLDRLTDLLEASFQKKLDPGYLQSLSQQVFKIYLAGDYEGCSILTYAGGVPYLCKFSVSPESQGKGLAGAMWEGIRSENSNLFWRSRTENPVNNWYKGVSDGFRSQGRWTVFWFGPLGDSYLPYFLSYSLSLAPTFKLE